MPADRRLLNEPLDGVRQVIALSGACLARTTSEARIYLQKGMSRTFARSPGAVSVNSGQILVSEDKQVKIFDISGKQLSSYDTGVGVSAMTRIDRWLVVGFEDGNIELIPTTPGLDRPSFSFEDTPSSPVVRLLPGPAGTVVAGYASGLIGIWYLENGTRLDYSRLHGPVVHIMRKKDKLYAATELGDHLSLDLSTFYVEYCKLLRQVWQQVPVIWRNGLPVLRKPPRNHRCYKRSK